MSSIENLPEKRSEGLQIPGLVQDVAPVEQLSFPGDPKTPYLENAFDLAQEDTAQQQATGQSKGTVPLSPLPASSPGATSSFLMNIQPTMTQALTRAISQANTGPLRPPVVIKGSTLPKRSLRPPQGRRQVISVASLIVLVVITVGTLLAVSPLGRDIGLGATASPPNSRLIQGTPNSNMNLVAQATATAVVHQQNDGYVGSYGGGAVVTGSPETWPYGVCTYWANYRYHQLTGVWVTWLGNAYQWADGAKEAGWNVSTSPHVPSIIVLEPGVQGASGYGHVAVVEKLVNSTTVYTSNMNWYTNGGGYGIVSYTDFTTGSGVYFIWK